MKEKMTKEMLEKVLDSPIFNSAPAGTSNGPIVKAPKLRFPGLPAQPNPTPAALL